MGLSIHGDTKVHKFTLEVSRVLMASHERPLRAAVGKVADWLEKCIRYSKGDDNCMIFEWERGNSSSIEK
jgi:hypothetical protein